MKTIEDLKYALYSIAQSETVVRHSDCEEYVLLHVMMFDEIEMLRCAIDELADFRRNSSKIKENIK